MEVFKILENKKVNDSCYHNPSILRQLFSFRDEGTGTEILINCSKSPLNADSRL